MNTLLDIGPLYEVVTIRGKDIRVTGLTAFDIFDLLVRFPKIRSLFDKGDDETVWNSEQLIKTAPPVVYAAIAICTGSSGEDKAEEIASKLPVADQLKLASVVLKLTFPEGVGPFAQQFREMTGKLTVEAAADSASPSQTASLASLQVDMPPQRKRGSTHHVN